MVQTVLCLAFLPPHLPSPSPSPTPTRQSRPTSLGAIRKRREVVTTCFFLPLLQFGGQKFVWHICVGSLATRTSHDSHADSSVNVAQSD